MYQQNQLQNQQAGLVNGIVVKEPIAGGVLLVGNNNPKCFATFASLNYMNRAEQRKFKDNVIVKEFANGTVFIRFTVDDVEKSWACLKDLPAWNKTSQTPVLSQAAVAAGGAMITNPDLNQMVLTDGLQGQVGAKYNAMNDTYELFDIDEGKHEIQVKYKIFAREINKTMKARIIRSSQANGSDSIVEFEFEQSPKDARGARVCYQFRIFFFIPIFWIYIPFILIYLVALTPVVMLKKCMGHKPRPFGKFLKHSESLRLRGLFHSYVGHKNLEAGNVPVASGSVMNAVKVGEPMPITESALPAGFGM